MRNVNSIVRSLIMLTALVVFLMVGNDMKGQCDLSCGSGTTVSEETISHIADVTNDNECFNAANGDCSVAAGFRSASNANYSFALGDNVITNSGATGSIATGADTYTDSAYSIAAGVRSHTGAEYSFALGRNCATNQGATSSFTFGRNNETGGKNAFAFGNTNTANGENSFIGGQNSFISNGGNNSIGFGDNIEITGNASGAFGIGLTQNGNGSFLAGEGFTNNVNENFQVGWLNSSTANTPVMYADLGDPFNNGFLGLNRVATVNTTLDIDLSVAGNAEKAGGGTTWTNPSDRRLKEDIQPFKDGLDVLMKFDPVSFKYNGKLDLATDQQEIGVIAQEVKEFAPYMIFGEETENSYLSYNSNALFYILVNSVQEQQETIQDQESTIKDYEERINKLEKQMEQFKDATTTTNGPASKGEENSVKEVTLSNISIEKPMLFQNEPNPFSKSTTIRYYVPENVTNAEIIIVSTENGQLLKRVGINETGIGTLNVNIEKVAAGNYTYALILDGQQTLSRQMVVGR